MHELHLIAVLVDHAVRRTIRDEPASINTENEGGGVGERKERVKVNKQRRINKRI